MRVDKIEDVTSCACSFGGVSAQATLKSSNEVECMAPPSHQDLVDVKLSSNEHDLTLNTGFTFQYYNELEIDSRFPESAQLLGETRFSLTIKGCRKDSSYVCAFGTHVLETSIVNNSTLNCNTLPRNQLSRKDDIECEIIKAYPSIFYAQSKDKCMSLSKSTPTD